MMANELVEPIFLEGVYMGWLGLSAPNDLLSVYDLLPDSVKELPWVLIASLDSGRGIRVTEMFERASKYNIFPQSAYRPLIDGCVVMEALSFRRLVLGEQLFSGFDEVWFFLEQPQEGPPAGTRITSEVCLTYSNHTKLQQSASQWCISSGAILGLGDGAGLNFVTPDSVIAQSLFSLASRD